jgi:hypothetical protein
MHAALNSPKGLHFLSTGIIPRVNHRRPQELPSLKGLHNPTTRPHTQPLRGRNRSHGYPYTQDSNPGLEIRNLFEVERGQRRIIGPAGVKGTI